MFVENNIENLKNRYEKLLKEPDLVKLFNFKFEKFTILQKLVSLWGLINYGFAYGTVLSEIPNIFSLTKSITYENEEILNFLNKTLEELKVDSYISSFENIKYLNFDKNNNFSEKFFLNKSLNVNFLKKNNEELNYYIYNLDPPMLNNTNWNFYYNKKIFDLNKIKNNNFEKKNNSNDKNIRLSQILIKPTKEILENYPIIEVDESLEFSNKKSGINLILSNPIFSLENKKILFNFYKEFIKKLSEKIEYMYNENQNYIKKILNGGKIFPNFLFKLIFFK